MGMPPLGPISEVDASEVTKSSAHHESSPLPSQYEYCRPELLGDYTKDQFKSFEHHHDRPVVTPKVKTCYRENRISG